MMKRRRDPGSDGTTSSSMEYNTVFVDTSLDTHIAMLLSDSDTVLDFKKKIMQEHVQCFPEIGEMWIHSLKVKRRGNFYHLPDFMLVWSAFQGLKRNWFLSADASCYTNQQSSDHQTNDHSRGLSSDVNEIPALKMALPDGVIAEIIDSEMIDGLKVEKSSDKTTLETEYPARKKQKIRCNEDLGHSPSLEKIQLHVAGACIKEPGTGHLEVEVDNIYQLSEPKVKGKAASVNNDLSIIDGKCKETDRPDIGNTIKEPKLSVGLMDAMVASKDDNLNGKKRKKKKSQKPPGKIQDTSDLEHEAWKGEGVGPHTETRESEKTDEVRELSHLELKVDNIYQLSELKAKEKASSVNIDLSIIDGKNKETDPPDIDVTIKEPKLSAGLMDAVVASKDGNVNGKKRKKKKSRKATGKIENTSDLEHEAWKGEGVGSHTETRESEKTEEVRGLSHLELKVDNIYQLSELKAKEKASSVNNDLSIIDGKNKETDRPDIVVTIKEPKLSAGLMDDLVASKDGNLNGKKRKKKKSRKAAGKIEDTSDFEHEAWKGEGVGLHTETRESEKTDEVRGLSPNYDCGIMVPLYSKASEFAVPESKLKEAGSTSKFLDGDMVVKPESSGVHGRKKRVNNSADTNLDKSDMEHINHGTSSSSAVLLCLPTNQVPEETDKGGSISVHKGKDVQMKLLDGSAAEAEEEVTSTDGNKSDLVKFTQAMEDVGVNEKMTNLARDPPLRNSENVLNKDKRTKKKTKRQLVASDVQENLPTRDQKVSFEVFATQENVSSYLNSVLDGRHVDSPQVVSHCGEEKLEEFCENAADTDDLARSFQNKDEGINFKHYFVHSKKQDKAAASGDKVKKATKSSGIKVKKHGLSSVSTSIELQSPLKSYESKDGKKQSLVMCATDRKDGDSAVNSNGNEAISNSTRKSLGGTGNGVTSSNLSETLVMRTLQKQNETPAASSFAKEKNLSLDKSSLGRSGSFPENRGDKRWLTELNVSNKTAIKTPQKSSLFMKVGAIFQDSSGESSGDDNGNAYSDSSTCSPSDSSSLSGCSKGESYSSQGSAKNGSKDAKGRSSGGKNLSKLDLSSSNEMTMDMILRSSKRFKKAKLIASQNELEQTEIQAMEFVPESQPIH